LLNGISTVKFSDCCGFEDANQVKNVSYLTIKKCEKIYDVSMLGDVLSLHLADLVPSTVKGTPRKLPSEIPDRVDPIIYSGLRTNAQLPKFLVGLPDLDKIPELRIEGCGSLDVLRGRNTQKIMLSAITLKYDNNLFERLKKRFTYEIYDSNVIFLRKENLDNNCSESSDDEFDF
jgi:hypothetical protein